MLSNDTEADLILMDEARGRQVANQMNLNIMGTIGILMTSFDEGLITREEFTNAIDKLRESGRYISEALYGTLMEHVS